MIHNFINLKNNIFILLYSQEIDDVNDIFPKLSAYLQLASNSALKGAPDIKATTSKSLDIKTSPPSSPFSDSPQSPTANINTSTATAVTTSTTSTASIGSKSKKNFYIDFIGIIIIYHYLMFVLVSLVPTNILMKPTTTNTSTAQFSFKPQQFICTKPAGSSVLNSTNSNGMPMKVLLVNTLQKPNGVNGASVTAKPLTTTVNIQPKSTTAGNVVHSNYQTRSTTAAGQATKTQTLLSSNKYLCSGSTNNAESVTKRPVTFKQKQTPGFRTFLSQLVQLQQRQLEISQQRLEVERERFLYERKTGDKIVAALSTLINQNQK